MHLFTSTASLKGTSTRVQGFLINHGNLLDGNFEIDARVEFEIDFFLNSVLNCLLIKYHGLHLFLFNRSQNKIQKCFQFDWNLTNSNINLAQFSKCIDLGKPQSVPGEWGRGGGEYADHYKK